MRPCLSTAVATAASCSYQSASELTGGEPVYLARDSIHMLQYRVVRTLLAQHQVDLL